MLSPKDEQKIARECGFGLEVNVETGNGKQIITRKIFFLFDNIDGLEEIIPCFAITIIP